MTDRDHLPDASPLDELASSILDGEATPDEQARATDPEVAARIAAFRAVSQRVAEPVAPPAPEAREAAIAAALAAVAPASSGADVVALAPRRRAPRWPPAVAAVVAVVALGAVVAGLASDGDDDTAASDVPEAADEDAGTFDTSAGEEGAAADAAPSPAAGGPATELAFAVPDLGDLGAAALPAAAAELRAAAGERTEDAGAVARDAGVPCADRFGTSLVALATARIDGVAVTVGILDDGTAGTYLALDQADCERQVATGELE